MSLCKIKMKIISFLELLTLIELQKSYTKIQKQFNITK